MDQHPGTCLVIGATGFVGSHVTQELKRKGYDVTAVTRDEAKAEFLKSLPGPGQVTIVTVKDISSPYNDQLTDISRGCRGIFFCAGYEKQEPATIDFMVNSVLNVSQALFLGIWL